MLKNCATIRPGLYRLPDDPIGPRILIPGFALATSVQGAFGWFTAGWIEKLAPGLAQYLSRDNTAPIEFTVSPVFFPSELAAAKRAYQMPPEVASVRVSDVFIHGRASATALGCHALDCLAWLLATNRLRLRIAVPTTDSNYHPKIWLFSDGIHEVLVRGSGNATGHGVQTGVEHLDVDVTWKDHCLKRVLDGVAILHDWARGHSFGIDRVIELPQALEQRIIKTAPDTKPTTSVYMDAVENDCRPSWACDPSDGLRRRFAFPSSRQQRRLRIPAGLKWQDGRYAHQGAAVNAWESQETPKRGTISMATGAGKTVTALICATRLQDQLGSLPFLIVISAPSIPLVMQWRDAVSDFGIKATAPSLERNAEQALTNLFWGLNQETTQVLIVTNKHLCSRPFQKTVQLKITRGGTDIHSLYIADEAHTLGAQGFLNNKPEFLQHRIALSATPERQYDPDGTEAVFSFMGPPKYEFGLDQAIGFCLVPYNYYVHAAVLGNTELEEFRYLTRRIGAAIGSSLPDEDNEAFTKLVIARRRIVETASSKLPLLRTVLERRGPRSLEHCLIYASSKNPLQFNQIGNILDSLSIRWAPVTQETTRDQRGLQRVLEAFQEGSYQVLLAKRVLDEGVDIPSVREAFLVASSTVQREWIQRRGRVLRMHANKPCALLHDFLALPPVSSCRNSDLSNVKRIIRTELDRAYSFAAHAQNATGLDGTLSDLARLRDAYWPDGAPSSNLRNSGDHLIASTTPAGRPW